MAASDVITKDKKTMIADSYVLWHVKNTGRCRELLQEGARVFLEESGNANRKTKHSLVAVYKGDMLVNMDSQAPNAVAAEAIKGFTSKCIGLNCKHCIGRF